MQHRHSWDTNRLSASQEIPHNFWNSKVHSQFRKCPQPVPILRHHNPLHASTFYFLQIHFNIILPSMPQSSKWSPSLQSPAKTLYAPLLFPSVLHTHPSNSPWFDLLSVIWRDIQSTNLLFILSNLINIHLLYRTEIQKPEKPTDCLLRLIRYTIIWNSQLCNNESTSKLNGYLCDNSWGIRNQLDVTCYIYYT